MPLIMPLRTVVRSLKLPTIVRSHGFRQYNHIEFFSTSADRRSVARMNSLEHNLIRSTSRRVSIRIIHTSNTTMTPQPQTIEDALSSGELFSDGLIYRFVKLPLSSAAKAATIVTSGKSNPFLGLLVDKDEVTLMLSDNDYQVHKTTLGEHEVGEFSYRLITFDVVLEPTLIGFMAYITKALAAAKISVMPFAAYSRDHIFVGVDNFDKAIEVLNNLK
jgi:hypothetical protein